MRIGITVKSCRDIHQNIKKFDGIGAYTYQLMQALKSNTEIEEVYFKRFKELNIIKQPSRHFTITENPIYQNYLPFNFFKNLEKKIDLLHVTDYFVPKLKNIKIVSTIHDATTLKYPQWKWTYNTQLTKIRNAILKQSAQYADHVITTSKAMIEDMVHYWRIPENKISVVYHGLTPDWFDRSQQTHSKELLSHHGINKNYLLFVGTLQTKKNLERILQAFESLPPHIQNEFILVISGKTHPRLTSNALKSKIQQLEEQKKAKWLHYTSSSDLKIIYQNASMLLFPSLEEGFGFPILEAFASKTPVLTSNFGGTKEIAADCAYLVDPYSVDHIRQGIIDLTEKAALREKLITTGHAHAKTFTWEKCALETKAIYKNLLS